MSPKFVRIAHQLLFWFMIVVAVTGIMKSFDMDETVLNVIHRSCGIIFILLILLHLHMHSKALAIVVFGAKK